MAAAALRSSFHGGAAAMFLILLFSLLAPAPTTVATSQSVSSAAAGTTFNGSCVDAERDALLSFKAGITSDPSRRLRSWRGQDCCRWFGVRCSTRTGHVLDLNLRNEFSSYDNHPHGFDHAVRGLRGQISSSLIALHRLRHLDLSGNDLGGNMPMPKFLGSLKSLTCLNLSNMNFHGPVPAQLGNLTKLVYLNIRINYFYEYAYSSDVSWLARLDSLQHLDMSGVDLSATVAGWVHSVKTLPNLRVLYLSSCGLNSSIPSVLHQNLTVLEKLDLSGNHFNSPVAPSWYWDITSLKSLDIANCDLSGPFPDELGNLTMLESLDMGVNNIKGMVPSTLTSLCRLRMIDLGYNNIGGDIKDLIERIPKCSWYNLQELGLAGANMTGTTLNWVLNLTSLSMLDISNNQLSGSVPVEIGTLRNLTELYIGSNILSGVMSEDHFAGLTNLKEIDLSDTHLQIMVGSDWEPPFNLDSAYLSSCHLGPQFPNWLQWQKGILNLDISNTGLIGRTPDWFWTTFSNALLLDLSYNQISGVLPLNLEFMALTELYLQSNKLTGLVPQLPRSMEFLDISQNSLNGSLSSNFGAPYLRVVVLFSNCITGIMPESICQWPQLELLDMSNNLLTRGLPDCGRKELKQRNPSSNNFSSVNFVGSYHLEIHTLLLNNNNLSGEFPLFLKQCQNLMFLDLTENRFSGKLPAWISEKMPRLVMLRLRSNNFSGHIPIETTWFVSLRILDLANNTFSGVIPQCLVNLKALTTTVTASDPTYDPFQEGCQPEYMYHKKSMYNDSLSSNDSLTLVIKGQVLDYMKNTIFLVSIDMSCNRLSGQIPEEIGSLIGLINLNLSSNFLSGNIPHKISNLQSLESLDFSNNQLFGEIPWGLSNLTSLSYLNLSYNNLSGKIPSGHQLDTLITDDPASMYMGNPGLCGYPLPKVCPEEQPTQKEPINWHEDDENQIDRILGFVLGFLVGFCIIFCALLFKKK